MNLLQKAYNAIKEKIEFAFFKRKFNAWLEGTDVKLIDDINYHKERIFKRLSEENFNDAFYHYKVLQNNLKEQETLANFQKYVLNNENNEH